MADEPSSSLPRRALVTGGSRGIGRAVVERFAAEGLDVVATGRDTRSLDALEIEAASQGLAISPAACDVTDERAVIRLVEERGPFDVVVANAGIASGAPLHRTTTEDLETSLAVNATGVFHVLRASVPGMRERGWGRAVVVASTAGVMGAPYTSAYTASKHAAVGLVRAIAAEVMATPVTVNAVCPTYVDTEMTRATLDRIADRTGRSLEEARTDLLAKVPLGRLVRPDEVAAAVSYLCSELAAPVNGQCLVLDGGGTP